MELACDGLLAGTPLRLHRAVSVEAEPRLVFRWLCQLKHAPYSYDLLDNFARRSPRELTPGAERLAVGQRFMSIFTLVSYVPDEQLTLRARRTAVTYAALSEGQRTRLLARVLFAPPGGRLLGSLSGGALAAGDLLMMRKQLLTLKALCERDAARAGC
ncbi:MAG TPA: hypothetical protein VHT25_03585 [Solirubrobacteraceae bacterium]|jgi:hypothetical protein|nr:hypothetical protein [Solirubrobacteraceae bacterium]